MRWDVGIDLGTENVRLADLKQGPVMDVPAALAFRKLHPIWIICISAAIGVAAGYGLGL